MGSYSIALAILNIEQTVASRFYANYDQKNYDTRIISIFNPQYILNHA